MEVRVDRSQIKELFLEVASNDQAIIRDAKRSLTIKETAEEITRKVKRHNAEEGLRYSDGKWRDTVTMETINAEGVTIKTADNEYIEIQGHLDSKTTQADVMADTTVSHEGGEGCKCHRCGIDTLDGQGYATQHKVTVTAKAVEYWFVNMKMPEKQRITRPSGKTDTVTYCGPDINKAITTGGSVEKSVSVLADGSTRTRYWVEWDVWLPACFNCKEAAIGRICKLKNRKKRED